MLVVPVHYRVHFKKGYFSLILDEQFSTFSHFFLFNTREKNEAL